MAWQVLPRSAADHRTRLIEALLSLHFIGADVARDLKTNVANWPEDQALIAYLTDHLITTDEQVNQAYAQVLNVPFVSLPDHPDIKVMTLIPKSVCESYGIMAYKLEGKTLSIAVANPVRIKENQPGVLSDLKKKTNYQFVITITSPDSFQKWLDAYPREENTHSLLTADQTKAALKAAPPRQLPTPPKDHTVQGEVNLVGRSIAVSLLQKVPLLLAEKYRFVVFDKEPDGKYALATEHSNDSRFIEVLKYIEQHNHVQLKVYRTDAASIDAALSRYPFVRPKIEGVVSLVNRTIPITLLHKIPYSVAEKYRFVVFDIVQNGPSQQTRAVTYKIATDTVDNQTLHKIWHYIEGHNGVELAIYSCDRASIDAALNHYRPLGQPPLQLKEPPHAEWLLPAQSPHLPQPIAKPAEQSPLGGAPVPPKAAAPAAPVIPPPPQPPLPAAPPKQGWFKKMLMSLGLSKPEPAILSEAPLPVTEQPIVVKAPETPVLPPTPAQPTPSEPTAPKLPIGPTFKDTGPEKLTVQPGHEKEVQQRHDALSKQLAETVKHDKRNEESEDDLGSLLEKDVETLEELQKIVKEGFVPRIVAAMVSYAITLQASDIHIEGGNTDVRVRFRVDGMLKDVIRLPLEQHAAIASRIKILAKLKIDETRIPQDGRFDVVFSERAVDLRISCMPTVHGEKIVMRILDKTHGIMTLEELGVVGRAFDVLIEAIKKPYGIVLSTGPTGSGKSTTLYAILNRISVPTVNVITLEDPVEYEIAGVNQSQIKPKIGFTFAEGLRSVLRQDPNIVMVGEIRDAETASMATHAALTGHLVLSTLHTNDAPGALPRLINMGVEPFLITSSINAIEAQRLVRKICPHCKEEIQLPPPVIQEIKEELGRIPENNAKDRARIKSPMKFYHGRGCDKCQNGYKGRIGIYEVLPMSDAVEELAISKSAATDIAKQAIDEGMITMKQDGLLKALEGMTTVDEVMRETSV